MNFDQQEINLQINNSYHTQNGENQSYKEPSNNDYSDENNCFYDSNGIEAGSIKSSSSKQIPQKQETQVVLNTIFWDEVKRKTNNDFPIIHKDLILNKLLEKRYILGKYLARGAEGYIFEAVKRVQNPNEQQQKIVLKIIIQTDLKAFKEEISIMKMFEKNISIIKYFDSFIVSKQHRISVIVLERCEKSLKEELEMIQRFSLKKFFKMVLDLFDGLIQFKIFKILHFDIKPDNVLIKEKRCLFTDFGVSSKQLENNTFKIKGNTWGYLATEVKQNKTFKINYKSDLYSLGLLFEQMVKKYKQLNNYCKIIQEFEQKILEGMINNNVEDRKDCEEYHQELISFLIETKESKIQNCLFSYLNTIAKVLEQLPFDNNKDTPFFLDTQIYYCKIKLQILEQQIKQLQTVKQEQQSQTQEQEQNQGNKQNSNNEQQNEGDFESKMVSSILKLNQDISNTHMMLGKCYQNKGDWPQSLKEQQKSLEINKELYKEQNNIDVATSLNNVGLCHQNLGESQKALQFLQESYQIMKELYKGTSDKSLAKALNNIGSCYQDICDYEGALKFYLDSLEMFVNLDKEDNTDKATTLNNIGLCYQNKREFDQAESYLQQSLKMREKLFEGNHPDKAISLNNLGLFYQLNGNRKKNYETALKYIQESLTMNQQQIKGDHPQIAVKLNNLSVCYSQLGNHEKALDYSLQSLEMKQQLYKDFKNHYQIATSLNNVALCYHDLEESKQALEYQNKSLEMYQNIYPGNHPYVATSLHNSGILYQNNNKQEEALKLLKQSLTMRNELFKNVKDHPDIVNTQKNIKILEKHIYGEEFYSTIEKKQSSN